MRRLLGGGGGSSGPVDWLIVGLGNPGERYARTPHNVGFAVAELLAGRWELPRPRQRYAGLFTEGRTGPGGPRVAILWPQTYMNEAGRSAGPARGALHTDPDIVAAYVLGRWRQSADEVRALVETAADAAERIVLGETAP